MMYSNKFLLMPGKAIVNEVNEAKESAEHCTLQMASNLEAGKSSLINILSQFPATALWLLHRYEADASKPEQAVEALMVTLAKIKSYYLLASLSFSGRGFKHKVDADEKQQLTEALQTFPFSIEDLLVLTELIIYAFKTRGDCAQLAKNCPDLFFKRLQGSSRRDKLKLPDIIDAMRASQFDEQFLFLSGADMRQYVTDMIFAEHLWLSSRQALAEANSGLVLFIANRYRCGFLDFDDLVQEGQTGLLRAIDKFDYRLGFQFSTYAAYWIRQAMSRALSRGERVVRVPCEQVANIHKVLRAKTELLSKTGREPLLKELSEYSEMPVDQISAILSISQTAVSLENLDDDEDSLAPIAFLEQQVFDQPFKKIEQSDLKAWVSKAIKILNPRELTIICCHFGINTDSEMTLQEIGAELHLTRERVRQIQVMALKKMKLNYGEQLMSFL
ncbi:MAG: RNA polymerase sigma factor RpoD/SigA [Methylobacter sp.]|uniref:RNA polymerase sigma factor RpoD/SigA n=1 Tax=Candidatus Methylobacter titanis TaxID=3053457 RepID=A0AA43Q9Z4_9GAMM|nr:RNA polymerase sigma factor RpoD/SigA [Candidatus Methylobacter titanis]